MLGSYYAEEILIAFVYLCLIILIYYYAEEKFEHISPIIEEKVVKENRDFQLSKIIAWAQPAPSSKGKERTCFWCITLWQHKKM